MTKSNFRSLEAINSLLMAICKSSNSQVIIFFVVQDSMDKAFNLRITACIFVKTELYQRYYQFLFAI